MGNNINYTGPDFTVGEVIFKENVLYLFGSTFSVSDCIRRNGYVVEINKVYDEISTIIENIVDMRLEKHINYILIDEYALGDMFFEQKVTLEQLRNATYDYANNSYIINGVIFLTKEVRIIVKASDSFGSNEEHISVRNINNELLPN